MTRIFSDHESAIEFSLRLFGLLRHQGIQLGTLQTIACTESIHSLETTDPNELLTIYRITLINRKEDLFHLERLYSSLLETYLSPLSDNSNSFEELEKHPVLTVTHELVAGESSSDEESDELTAIEGYSIQEIDHHKDFRLIAKEDFPAILAELEKIAKKHATIFRRKSKRTNQKGRIDLRSSIRNIAKFDGDIVEWKFKKKIPSRTHLVIVVDVSGSMEIYNVFLLNFLRFLHKNKNFKIEIFVFSTHLEPLTEYFQLKSFEITLESISLHFAGWSGGTKIGQAIETLNESYPASVTSKTVAVIMSDGWDTGDTDLLQREMAKLSNRARSVIWINPLKGDPSYEPLAIGMSTARPYCNDFISGHSLEALETFVDLIKP